MDKVLSSRVDESVVRCIGMLAHQLNTSKKKVIETAVMMYAEQIAAEQNLDVLDRTFGAWKRDESATATASASRKAFRDGMARNRQ